MDNLLQVYFGFSSNKFSLNLPFFNFVAPLIHLIIGWYNTFQTSLLEVYDTNYFLTSFFIVHDAVLYIVQICLFETFLAENLKYKTKCQADVCPILNRSYILETKIFYQYSRTSQDSRKECLAKDLQWFKANNNCNKIFSKIFHNNKCLQKSSLFVLPRIYGDRNFRLCLTVLFSFFV